MDRLEITENMRRIRMEEARDPVDRAFFALASLDKHQREEVVLRFNSTFDRATPSMRMTITIREKGEAIA